MKKAKFRIVALMLTMVMLIGGTMTVFATDVTAADALAHLKGALTAGDWDGSGVGMDDAPINHTYPTTDGGFSIYQTVQGGDSTKFYNVTEFNKLTAAGKQSFLKDQLSIANLMAYETENKIGIQDDNGVTDATVNLLTQDYQNNAGMGSTLLATLLQDTKPDFVTANRMYTPFSGPVGTALGIIAILIMAALGITMALDLAYITIPAFQMMCGGGGQTGGGPGQGEKKGIGGAISMEAKKAVQAADGGGNGQAGAGDYKAAVWVYLKYRWVALAALGLCLLYLVQGQVWNFVGWFVDLFSGFLGF